MPVWLSDVVGLSKTDTGGIVFSCLSVLPSVSSHCLGSYQIAWTEKPDLEYQPVTGIFRPLFLYVFAPLLRFNIWAGALIGGVFIGFVFPFLQVPELLKLI